ncbi:MAG: hypothetical protein ACK4M7_05540, partial [Burkholderiales bacterium]
KGKQLFTAEDCNGLTHAAAKHLFNILVGTADFVDSQMRSPAHSLDVLCVHRNIVVKDRKFNFFGCEPNYTRHAQSFLKFIDDNFNSPLAIQSIPKVAPIIFKREDNLSISSNNAVSLINPVGRSPNLSVLIAEFNIIDALNSNELLQIILELLDDKYSLLNNTAYATLITQLIERCSQIVNDDIFNFNAALELLQRNYRMLVPANYEKLVLQLIKNTIKIAHVTAYNTKIINLVYESKKYLLPDEYKDIIIQLTEKFIDLDEYGQVRDGKNVVKLLEDNQNILQHEYAMLLVKSITNLIKIITPHANSQNETLKRIEHDHFFLNLKPIKYAIEARTILSKNKAFLLDASRNNYYSLIIQFILNCSKVNHWQTGLNDVATGIQLLEENKDILQLEDYRKLVLQLIINCSQIDEDYRLVIDAVTGRKLLNKHKLWLAQEGDPKNYQIYRTAVINLFKFNTSIRTLEKLLTSHGRVISAEIIIDKYQTTERRDIARAILNYVQKVEPDRQIKLFERI